MDNNKWIKAAKVTDIPENGGIAVLIENSQIAIFNFSGKNTWYATENKCPHRGEQCLARGLLGDSEGEAKVACPFHKRTFSLESGKCLNGEEYEIKTYPIKIENEEIYVMV